MDVLKAELARKRKELEDTKLLTGKKKYFKRSELEEKQSKIVLEKHFAQLKSNAEAISSEDEAVNKYRASRLEKRNQLNAQEDAGHEKKLLPRHEVIRRLRERHQPIRIFGESDEASARRLTQIEVTEPQDNGMRNDFKDAMEKSEMESLNEIMNSLQPKDHSALECDVKEDGIELDEIIELTKNVRERGNDSILVLRYIKFMVKKWGSALNNRLLKDKLDVKGRIETALHSQTSSYLKPLLRKLKTKDLPDDILDSLVKIFLQVIDRNYIKANEYFLEMAIGNAPWPIGATMVGIHARPGRERISSKHVAHVLNDETQRKYIQAVKRLISKCQQYFPTDPSRCVEFDGQNQRGSLTADTK